MRACRATRRLHGRATTASNQHAGQLWTIGMAADVEWIHQGITRDCTITSAMPAVFEAYATITELRRHGPAGHTKEVIRVVETLRAYGPSRWWLGYLDTGSDDVVFPSAERVHLYADWPYVLVEAGPDEALAWRDGQLPELMFPTDKSWLVTTLWDDTWTCIGGAQDLLTAMAIESTLNYRSVHPGEYVAPPGHQCI